MPGKDRTGPEGQGSRTGRQEGKCNPKDDLTPESLYGMGRGMGKGVGQAAGRAARPGAGKGKGKGLRQAWRHGGHC